MPRFSPLRGSFRLGYIALVLAVILPEGIFCSPCQAQRNSGAVAITLTAVLSQSLTMSVAPAAQLDFFSSLLDRSGDGKTALTISTKWVRGTASISVGVFAPANPLLGARGQALVPVEASSVGAETAFTPFGNTFLSSSREQESPGSPEIRINTGDLQIPAGSEAGALTIRAQVL